jgi:hypothetical protein
MQAFSGPMTPTKDGSATIIPGNNSKSVTTIATFSFDDLIQAVDDVMRKPLSVRFKLHVNQFL